MMNLQLTVFVNYFPDITLSELALTALFVLVNFAAWTSNRGASCATAHLFV